MTGKELEQIRKIYSDLRSSNQQLLSGIRRRLFLVSMGRLMAFLLGAVAVIFFSGFSLAAGLVAFIVSAVVFLYLVRQSSLLSEKSVFTASLIRINENELKALDEDLSPFDGGADLKEQDHDFSDDIDLFGDDSLFRFLNRCVTGPGRSILADLLSYPSCDRSEILRKQEAVKELAGKLSWRQEFIAAGSDKKLEVKDIESLDVWLNETDNLLSAPITLYTAWVMPIIAIATLILSIAGTISFSIFILIFLINLFFTGLFLRRSNRIHSMVSKKHLFLLSAGKLISSIERETFRSALLADIRSKICTADGSVSGRIKELDKIINLFDSRLNLFVGFILNGLLLWDFQCIIRLERWRKIVAHDLPAWLTLLGEVDALCSLANYSYNNPYNPFPEVFYGEPVIDAEMICHPLLRRGTRVCNDFNVNQQGQVVIITGANMAGKSTFLRTVAVNLVLGMAGAPVCARKMKFTPVKLFTSMRTTDSLSHNESYFYAELKRLKVLKEKMEKGEKMFFILDEILKGTNSNDKSLGSKLLLRRFIGLGGTGMIATHDISLGEMEIEHPGNIVNKSFEIGIEGEAITFDYVLRDGITRKMNAAILMRQMGIT